MSALANNSLLLGSSATLSQNLVIKSNVDGTFTIERQDGTDLITIDAAGKVSLPLTSIINNGPCFRVFRNANQAVTSGVAAKIQWNAATVNTGNAFDITTNYRFQPTVAGFYHIILHVLGNGTATTQTYGQIYLNGVLNSTTPVLAGAGQVECNQIIYLNGTTDYIEGWASITASSAPAVQSSAESCYMSGYLVRAA